MEGNYITNFKNNFHNINENNFDSIALELFKFQAVHNSVYASYLTRLGCNPYTIENINSIPFLPIRFYKTHTIKTGAWNAETIFVSSGTTGTTPSINHVADTAFYLQNARNYFEKLYRSVSEYVVLALLPSYLERDNSSLVCMVKDFIEHSNYQDSGFYLNEYEKLKNTIQDNRDKKILLIGVSFALLDFAAYCGKVDFSHCTILETGGMKGRRKELTREELHEELCHAFGTNLIHSEYGMTELFSQGYSSGMEGFQFPETVKILLRETDDPFFEAQKRGVAKIIDLANFTTCAFIETEDIFEKTDKNRFKILGRLDISEMRGCNLLVY